MVSIEEAIKLVDVNTVANESTATLLLNALDQYTLQDIYSPINMPPFNQSAMDGYAVLFDNEHQNNFVLTDEIKAGDSTLKTLKPGEAVRIFTGAPTPTNANAVIMQENTSVQDGILTINDVLTPNKNIRLQGEQIKKGDIALKANTKLNAAGIGFLTTLGITTIEACKKPKIAIVVTGNELATPGTKLEFGQIYESNAIMLQAALVKKGFHHIETFKVKDNYQATKTQLEQAINNNDFVLISGGISVGDYDFVGKALLELNTEQIFYKIKQKPGKPLFYGKNNNTNIFALPGNPASALTCFYIYIEAALQKFIGNPNYKAQTVDLVLQNQYVKKGSRGEFLKAYATSTHVEILTSQSSAMLNTFSNANALVYLKENAQIVEKGTVVSTYLIN